MNTQIFATGRHCRPCSIDVIHADGKVMCFGHVGAFVDEIRFCKGAIINHLIVGSWHAQVIVWGEPITREHMVAIVEQFLGQDR